MKTCVFGFGQPASRAFLFTAAIVGLSNVVVANDVVTVIASKDGQKSVRLVGEITEYTGIFLEIRLVSGREQRIAASSVREIHTSRSPIHFQADQSFENSKFKEGLVGYDEALRVEPREWMKRQIRSRLAWCHQGLRQYVQAGDICLELCRNEPASPYLDALPLTWKPVASSEVPSDVARRWLQNDQPYARLLGSSWLLLSADNELATKALHTLSKDDDERVSALAVMQLWRARIDVATQAEVSAWQERVQRMPATLRGGPYFIIGQAMIRLKQPDSAALAFLRVPIDFPHNREMAAEALLFAAQSLQIQSPAEANRLYDEARQRYGDTVAVVMLPQKAQ